MIILIFIYNKGNLYFIYLVSLSGSNGEHQCYTQSTLSTIILTNPALIKVVGVGGGGGNAVNHMVMNMVKQEMGGTFVGESSLTSEEHGRIVFYAVNTDAQALRKSQVQQTVQIGGETTKGLGAGANRILVVRQLKMIRMKSAKCLKVPIWSLLQQVWAAAQVRVRHLLLLKLLKNWVF